MSIQNEHLDEFSLDPHLGRLRSALSAIPERHRVAFGAWCCDRLRPFYDALAQFLGIPDNQRLKAIHDRLWKHVAGHLMTPEEVASNIEQCDMLEAGEENCCQYWDGAIDAVGATMLALEACRGDSAKNAAKAGASAVNPLYQMLVDEHLGDSRILAPGGISALHEWTDSHPRMQAERQRQLRVIEFLRDHRELRDREIRELRSGRV